VTILRIINASAPSKIILVGEHFVVEGEPAIAAAINLRAKVKLEPRTDEFIKLYSTNTHYSMKLSIDNFEILDGSIDAIKFLEPIRALIIEIAKNYSLDKGFNLIINSQIPIAVGLGSSASILVACSASILKFLLGEVNKDLIIKFASKAEEVAHARPSGIDPTITTYGGILIYRRIEGFLRLNVPKPFKIIIGVSSLTRSTGEMVKKVRNLKNKYPEIFDPLYHAAGHLAIEAARAIEKGDLNILGELMNINHGLLSSIGVSNLELERLVYAARSAGALGAKITGAGGGGSIIALPSEDNVLQIAKAIEKVGGKAIIANISKRGVIIGEK